MFAPPSARCNFFKCTPPNLKSWIRPCTLRFYFPYLSLLYFILCSDIFQHIILIYFNVFPSLIIFNIFLLFIATELLLVIANSCLEAFATWITHRRLCRVKKMLAMYLKYFRYIANIFFTLHKRLWITVCDCQQYIYFACLFKCNCYDFMQCLT